MNDEVSYYGVHWAPGKIAFLQQARGGSNAIGLREASPFIVRPKRRWTCNHLIQLNSVNPARGHLGRFEELVSRNSLVRFMLPLPKEADLALQSGVGVFSGDLMLVTLLLKMSSPVRLPYFSLPMVQPRMILDELQMTNVQPVVVTEIGPKHTSVVAELVAAARNAPRRLLLLAHPDVPLTQEVLLADHMQGQTINDLAALPWESLGSIVLRAYMRNEWGGLWFTREPIPGNETKG